VDPKVGLDRCGKFHPPPGFDPQTIQPVASRYTDYSIAGGAVKLYDIFRAKLVSWFTHCTISNIAT
jgi:hypothetical protein